MKFLQMTTLVVAGGLASMMPVTGADAAIVTLSNITATWIDPHPSNGITINNNQSNKTGYEAGYARAAWGTPSPNNSHWTKNEKFEHQSGYDFNVLNSSVTENFSTPYSSDLFNLGVFTHRNNPITGTSLDSIQLKFTADLYIGNTFVQNYQFIFDFTHDETDNNPSSGRCDYGGRNNQGINVNGCADKVTVNFNQSSDKFLIDGVYYTLDLEGFMADGSPATSFLSKEKGNNSATIVGKIAAWDDVTGGGTGPAPVPETSTWAMMLIGFAGVGTAMRRRTAVRLRFA